MARRIVIGLAWWLAVAYAFQMGTLIYGFPSGVGPIAAIPVALLIAIALPRRVGRPVDRRRIYEPRPDGPAAGTEPAASAHR
jgi:hypothetical protein